MKIPLQTVSAPATAVPHMAVEPQLAKEAEDATDKNDFKDKTEDDLPTNKDLADRVQSTARQLSSKSAAGERQDTMLNLSASDSPSHVLSATETAEIPRNAHRPQRTSTGPADMIPRTMYGGKDSVRGPPQPPQGYGPNRPRLPSNGLALPWQRSLSQQRIPTGPFQQQRNLQNLGPHNQCMQPPNTGHVLDTSTQGMPPVSGCFPPLTTGPQLDVGVGEMSGMSGMSFQNQMPMYHSSSMGESQFGHPQPSSTSAATHYIGQQNIGAPMYQPNGYIPQMQKQARHDKGDKKKRQDDRGDSMNSIGSRNKKIRDDPIHGPVYALKSCKDSHIKSGRKSSNSDGSTGIKSKQLLSNPNLACRNQQVDIRNPKTCFGFVDCPCLRCLKSTRSLYVKHKKLPRDKVQAALMNYLSPWGAESVTSHHEGHGSTRASTVV
jgi:hypothetical protein